MSDLSIAWRGDGRYVVFSEKDDGDDMAYRVDLDGDHNTACTCKHGITTGNGGAAACKHIQAAVEAHPSEPDLERETLDRLNELARDVYRMQSQASDLLDMAEVSRSAHAAMHEDADSEAAEGGSEDDSDDGGDDGVVTEADPNEEQQALMDDLESWFNQAGGFNDFDPRIISLSWVEADGVAGIHVDRQPFDGGYYDDGEWQDKDVFDEHKETVKDTVLSPRDEFEWYGEPDYSWFIAEDDVSEVLE